MRRSKSEIATEILKQCKKPQSRYAIVRNANLNSDMAKDHLQWLESKGLVISAAGKYHTTEQGMTLLTALKEIDLLII